MSEKYPNNSEKTPDPEKEPELMPGVEGEDGLPGASQEKTQKEIEQKETADDGKTERDLCEVRERIDELSGRQPMKTETKSQLPEFAEKRPIAFDERTRKKESDAGLVKRMGMQIGKSLEWVIDRLRSRVQKFEIEQSGIDFLKEIEGPYVLAANHIKPENKAAQAMALATDAFIFEKVVKEVQDKKLNIIAQATGRVGKTPVLKYLNKILLPLREGVMESVGFIPVRVSPGSFNRDFLRHIEGAVKRGEPILIFPEGHWYEDFSPDHQFKDGAAFIAEKYDLPIVPAYIKGGRSWSSKEKAKVRIGKSFRPGDQTRRELTEEIRKRITLLQEEAVAEEEQN